MEYLILSAKEYIFKGKRTGYLVTPDGKVYSTKNNKIIEMKQTRASKKKRNRVSGEDNYYVKVRLSINGKIYNRCVHRMIAETFIPNPENKPEVNHIDGIKYHNWVSNLEWSTRKENSKHGYVTGLFGIGEDFSKSKITNKQCKKICKLLQDTSMTLSDIGHNVGCSKKIVADIFHGKTWTHISNDYDFSNRKRQVQINEKMVHKICELLEDTNLSSKEISELVGCKVYQVKDIKRGKTWTNISKMYNFNK